MITQQNALDELKKENVGLYEAAIMFDQELIPMTFKGPVATPPIENYIQDGEYKDTTQSFKVSYETSAAHFAAYLVDYLLNICLCISIEEQMHNLNLFSGYLRGHGCFYERTPTKKSQEEEED